MAAKTASPPSSVFTNTLTNFLPGSISDDPDDKLPGRHKAVPKEIIKSVLSDPSRLSMSETLRTLVK